MSGKKHVIDILTNKATMLLEAGFADQAIALYSDILSMYPDHDELKFKLARLNLIFAQSEQALPLLRSVTPSSPFFAEALFLLGTALGDRRDYAGGADCFSRLLELDDTRVEYHNNLAMCMMELRRPQEAYRHLVRAIQLAPGKAETYNTLGNLLVRYWRLAEAAEQYRRAIELKNDYVGAYSNLGRIANFEGRVADAVAFFDKALELQPDFRTAADNLLFIINNTDIYTPEQIRDEHLRLADIYDGPVEPHGTQHQHRQGAKIRVGYVSPDFRNHSVGFFIEPVLRSHNREHFEIYCYDQASVPDDATKRIKNLGWAWRTIYGLSDTEVVDQIQEDCIDILVDLAGHSEGNRLGVFARRPALVQVTWLGYPNTTGLKQINFRMTDDLADPSGMTDHLYSEQLVRLPRSFLCYAPPLSAPEVAPFPDGPITFCCFNHYPKISDTVLNLWARVLHVLPDARFSLKSGPLGDVGVRDQLIRRFAVRGIDRSRLILSSFSVGREEHLQRYGVCHIALDTYPYAGTTTTCESLWMGVPVVTLAGITHVSRVGVSILENAGIPELIAMNEDQYVGIAVALARNQERLQEYRKSLRARLFASPLMDAITFTSELEQAYRRMLGQPYA